VTPCDLVGDFINELTASYFGFENMLSKNKERVSSVETSVNSRRTAQRHVPGETIQ
jgi:hypothetical protein